MIKRSAGLGGRGCSALGFRGDRARRPDPQTRGRGRDKADLWVTPWGRRPTARRSTCAATLGISSEEIISNNIEVRVRPGGPGRGLHRDRVPVPAVRPARRREDERETCAPRTRPVMLIRLRPGTQVHPSGAGPGEVPLRRLLRVLEGLHPTWAARPSLFEAQTNRILCPCHQSQFPGHRVRQADLRPGHQGACHNFPSRVGQRGILHRGPLTSTRRVGPGFWERRS